jgi:hypothetical protein
VIEERWAVNMIRSVFKLHFPQEGECVMKPLLQKDPHGSHVTEITVICNDAIQFKDDPQKATWKEIIVTKEPLRLQVFNLVSHARRMFRSLVYTSNQKFSLHSLSSVDRKLEREIFFKFKDEAGSFKKRVANESTLEIRRKNQKLFGEESYVPSRFCKALFPLFYSRILIFGWELMRFCEVRQVARCIGLITALKPKFIRILNLVAPQSLVDLIGNFQESVPTQSKQRFLRRGTVTPRTQHCIDDLAATFPRTLHLKRYRLHSLFVT